jgi:hypothetical protein
MGMMRRRARRRTALVVGGAAYAAGRRRQGEDEEQAAPQEVGQEEYSPVPPAPAPSQTGPDLAGLEKLGDLHEKGILTDAEFAAEKAKILGE